MSLKKIEINRKNNLKNQASWKNKKKVIKFINYLLESKYLYNFNWLGVPIIQYPSDIVVLQELIYKQKPDVIIECGIGHGGSLILYSSILSVIKKKFKIIGVDIEIKKDNKKNILNHKLSKNIKLIEGSSTNIKVIKNIKKMIGNKKNILVILDSNHTHRHVLNELNVYKKFIKKNNYIVVLDTLIEFINKKFLKNKLFSKGNSPHSAVKEFLKKNKEFRISKFYENKAYMTSAYDGFLIKK
tara:strand:+ start:162 stop:887 length:726 start_codon:yes stop_codon:yes gene_type:complete